MLKKLQIAVLFALVALLSFAGTSMAAAAVAPSDDANGPLLELLKPVYEAFATGHKMYAGALALVLLVALARKYLAPRVAFLRSDAGGAAMALLGSFGAAMATSLAGGAGITLAMAWRAMVIAVGAAGGYSLAKKLVVDPLLRPLALKLPPWAQPIAYVVLWVFEQPTAVEKAEKDGAAAVAVHPGAGLDGITGAPTDVP